MRGLKDKLIFDLAAWVKTRAKPRAKPLVFTNGCFDIVHAGHIEMLYAVHHLWPEAEVVVGINGDLSVRQLKGPGRPVNNQEYRLLQVAALEPVDYCFVFDEVRCARYIRQISPDYWVKGGDYKKENLATEEVEAAHEIGAEIIIIPRKYEISTTKILWEANLIFNN